MAATAAGVTGRCFGVAEISVGSEGGGRMGGSAKTTGFAQLIELCKTKFGLLDERRVGKVAYRP
ncbi:MAG: hypothetical protein IPK83_01770 [Planctomycetes bacterium]|nr:hypothetical protein [Planctomycetota bacterium]